MTVQGITLRLSHAEDKIGDICHAQNNVIEAYNAYNDHEEAIKRISVKLADLKDGSHHITFFTAYLKQLCNHYCTTSFANYYMNHYHQHQI